MSTATSLMSLVKPDLTDTADIAVLNSNADLIDAWATTSAASNAAVGDSATSGSTSQFARVDHKHGMPNFGAPVSVTTANGNGVATTIARSDHAHAIGAGAINSNAMFASGCIPTVRVYNSSSQTISTSTTTYLAMNTERWDTDTIHDNATNNSRLTCVTAGKYYISGEVVWDDSADSGVRGISILLNRTKVIASLQFAADGSNYTHMSVGSVWALAATDYVELAVIQGSGGDLSVLGGSANSAERCDFGMTWLAP